MLKIKNARLLMALAGSVWFSGLSIAGPAMAGQRAANVFGVAVFAVLFAGLFVLLEWRAVQRERV